MVTRQSKVRNIKHPEWLALKVQKALEKQQRQQGPSTDGVNSNNDGMDYEMDP